jgi:photosystem II stability/assembly factor-like uncharacterized protein
VNASFVPILALCAVSLALAAPARAQSCTIPAPAEHETHLIWGGETRQVFVQQQMDGVHIHTAEDGGRIRRSTNGGATWTFAVTPPDCTQSLLDVWFNASGSRGYACGRGGKILISVDGGVTWQHIDPLNPVHLDESGEPATLWRVRFLDDSVGFVAGLHVFAVTTNGGFGAWTDIGLFTDASLTVSIDLDDLELYCLDVIGVPGAFVGVAGAEWEDGGIDRGVVFHTDATVQASSVGRKWWVALDDTQVLGTGSMIEPWDIEYERGSTGLHDSRAYVVGGPGGNNTSRHYFTDNSGATWTLGGTIPVTMYGVAAMPDGYAMMCGYSGNVWSRAPDADPNAGKWTPHPIPAVGGVGNILTAPQAGIHGLTSTDYVLVGAFGTQRRTHDYGLNWDYLNPTYGPTHGEQPWRVSDVFFLPGNPSVGFLSGQVQLIAKTTDGGCTWVVKVGGIQNPDFDSAPLRDIEFADNLKGIAVGGIPPSPPPDDFAALWRTVDGGDTWTAGTISGALATDTFALNAVSHATGGAWWAVGTKNAGPPLVLYTRTTGSLWFQMATPPSPSVSLVDVEFLNASEGIAIGNDAGVGRAYRASFNGTAVTWTPIPLSGVGALHALELEGATLAAADGYIVGDDGVVQRWNGTSFDPVDTSVVYNGVPLTLTIDLFSVALAPDSEQVMIGAQYDFDEANAEQEGMLLRFDGTQWECLRGNAGYDIRTIQILPGGDGYVLGGIDPFESATFDHGKVADAALLHYEPD